MKLTVVGNCTITLKMTFKFNFDLNQAVNSIDTHKHKSQEKLSIKKVSF